MARETFTATINTIGPTFGRSVDAATPITTAKTDGTTADTAVGTVVTDNTATLAAIDAFAASVIAITGDTYVAHQFVTGGATGLTHAQWATQAALMNTAITAFLAGQTATNTAKTATALVKTDLAAVPSVNADVVLSFNVTNVGTVSKLKTAVRALLDLITGQDIGLTS